MWTESISFVSLLSPYKRTEIMVPLHITLPHSKLTMHGFQSNPGAPLQVLALHGWLDNCFSFKPLSEKLPELNIIAFDLPGHGDSQFIPAGMSYDFHYYLVWLHELLEALNISPVVLLGHSMGAVIASLYAGVFPERLASLILIEGLGPFSVAESEAPAKMKAYIESWSKHSGMRNGLYASWDEAVKARQKSGHLKLSSAELLAQRGAQAQGQGYMWKHDPRLKLPSRYQFSEAQTLAFLQRITKPTLHIIASESLLTGNLPVEARTAAVTPMQEVKIEGGHHLHLDDPLPVAQSIAAFLRKHPPSH